MREIFNPKSNGLGFIRLALSMMVVWHHASWLSRSNHSNFVLAVGAIAVDSFFALSGYLITRSYIENPSFWRFSVNRILRIYPAFWACLLFSGLIFYPVGKSLITKELTAIPWMQAIDYFLSNFTLNINDELFEWFANGSFWTLKYEFICYSIIALLGVAGQLKTINLLAIFAFFTVFFISHHPQNFHDQNWYYGGRLLPYFFVGAIYYLEKDKIKWSWQWWGLSCTLILLGYSFIPLRTVTIPVLTYFLLGLTKIAPKNFDRKYGDYSYGLYLYHYPFCDLLNCLGVTNGVVYFLIVLSVSGMLAFLSWHYIEKPFLKLKNLEIFSALGKSTANIAR